MPTGEPKHIYANGSEASPTLPHFLSMAQRKSKLVVYHEHDLPKSVKSMNSGSELLCITIKHALPLRPRHKLGHLSISPFGPAAIKTTQNTWITPYRHVNVSSVEPLISTSLPRKVDQVQKKMQISGGSWVGALLIRSCGVLSLGQQFDLYARSTQAQSGGWLAVGGKKDNLESQEGSESSVGISYMRHVFT